MQEILTVVDESNKACKASYVRSEAEHFGWSSFPKSHACILSFKYVAGCICACVFLKAVHPNWLKRGLVMFAFRTFPNRAQAVRNYKVGPTCPSNSASP